MTNKKDINQDIEFDEFFEGFGQNDDNEFNEANYTEEDIENLIDNIDYENLTEEEIEYLNILRSQNLIEEQEEYTNDQYVKDIIDEKIAGSFLGRVKSKFLNFKYNGSNSGRFDIENESYDEKKKMFLIMLILSFLIFSLIIFFVMRKQKPLTIAFNVFENIV